MYKSIQRLLYLTLVVSMAVPTILVERHAHADTIAAESAAVSLAYGTNLHALVDWNPEFVLVDAFKLSREWLPQNVWQWDTFEYDKLAQTLDANGWVRRLPLNDSEGRYRWVGTVLFSKQGGRYPAGNYIVLYDGKGTIEYGQDAVKIASSPGRDVIQVDPNRPADGILLRIVATDPYRTGDYIRNIRVLMPGFDESNYRYQTFYPPFLNSVTPYHVLRFMDWQRTNWRSGQPLRGDEAPAGYDDYYHPLDVATQDPTLRTTDWAAALRWENRPQIGDARYSSQLGAPIELMIDLANTVDADPWFNIPHPVDNEYVWNYAQLVLQRLESNRVVYVEYSNEAWNTSFDQNRYMQTMGRAAWPASSASLYELGLSYYAMRSAQVCSTWKEAWGSQSWRVRCVLSGQAAEPTVTRMMLECKQWQAWGGCGRFFDVLGIAPYFGQHLADDRFVTTLRNWAWSGSSGLNKLFEELQWGTYTPAGITSATVARALQRVVAHKTLADQYGLSLVAYEGGQHLVPPRDLENDAQVLAMLAQANRDPRMGQLYDTYLNGWKQSGGSLFVHYKSMSIYDKWGYWGAQEYYGQTTAPKRDAIKRQIDAITCPGGCAPLTPRIFLPAVVSYRRIIGNATAPSLDLPPSGETPAAADAPPTTIIGP